MNIHSSLIAELKDKDYRDAYVASQIKVGLPFVIRALRRSRELTQEQLGELTDMSQPRIAEIEKPGKRQFNLETLLRIASAFDVGLEVRFVPFGDVIDHSEEFDPETFAIATFEQELKEAESQSRGSIAALNSTAKYNPPQLSLVSREANVRAPYASQQQNLPTFGPFLIYSEPKSSFRFAVVQQSEAAPELPRVEAVVNG